MGKSRSAGGDVTFRFVHTADLHLDAPLKAIALRDQDLAAEVGAASRAAFTRIVDLCIDEDVAFLIIAGDLWDGTYSSTKTPRFLKQELLRLRDHKIPAFLIRGNHDAMSTRTGELDLPDNAHLFGNVAGSQSLTIGDHHVLLHGLSFAEPHAPDSLLPLYPAPQVGAFNIGLMHTSLGGSEGHSNYAPVSVAALDGAGYDYWALGHIHKRDVHVARSTIVMPGNPQGRDIGESGERSVTLVTVDDDHGVTIAARSVASLRFDRCNLDISGAEDWGQVVTLLEDAVIRAAHAARAEDHLVLRPRLTGQSPMAWRIRRDMDVLTENARAAAGHAGIWIDKLEQAVLAPQGAGAQGDLPADLVQLVQDVLPNDPALLKQVMDVASAFQSQLPDSLRDILGDDEDALRAACQSYIAEGMPVLLSHLMAEGA